MCRELTKTYEEVVRLPLGELVCWAEGGVRGEITVVIAGAVAGDTSEPDAVVAVLARVASGERLKDAAAAVASETGHPKGRLYNEVLAARSV